MILACVYVYCVSVCILCLCVCRHIDRSGLNHIISNNVRGCQSDTWLHRGKKVKAKGSYHGDNPLLKPTGIQIATKFLPDQTTREHLKLVRVKTMSLGTSYSFFYLTCCQNFTFWVTSYREAAHLPKSLKVSQKVFLLMAFGELHKTCYATLYKECYPAMSKRFIKPPYSTWRAKKYGRI